MLSKTHIASSITVGLTVISLGYECNLREFIPALIIGAIMPDIDTSKSWASQTIPLVDDVLRRSHVLKHRGVTHGITGIVAMILLYFFIRNDFTLGFAIGYATHCISDGILSIIRIDINNKTDKVLYNIFWFLNFVIIIYYILNMKGVIQL